MLTPEKALQQVKQNIKKEWKIAFIAAFVIGLLIHMPVMLSDIPNHDGLSSMYFDQNMITSGRWFLTVACGLSSYFTLPWFISILAMLYLAITAAVLAELLQIKNPVLIVLVSGLLVSFPATASTFSYVFTMDGYMLALLLAVLAVYFTGKSSKGFVAGGICLAFSMGTYQAYLPFAMILSIYAIVVALIESEDFKSRMKSVLSYLYMGIIGVSLYYIILQVLLKIQGKELATYQGINGMLGSGSSGGIMPLLYKVYADFAVFTFKGNIIYNNFFSLVAVLALAALLVWVVLVLFKNRKWWKSPGFFAIIVLLGIGLPIAANVILIVSPGVTYHLLMRYQWVLFLILMVAFVNRYGKQWAWAEWLISLSVLILVFNYAVTDNIGYANLQKRYEKTYAYCVRLLDRIEQAEGYYPGIPIAMVGVVGYDQFPITDITMDVTGGMIGVSGDTLLYTADNYQDFMKHYLGATLNFLDVDRVGEIYFSEEYIAMDSFPGDNSVKVVDGIVYVKTENIGRD